jgi:hypothetical protein
VLSALGSPISSIRATVIEGLKFLSCGSGWLHTIPSLEFLGGHFSRWEGVVNDLMKSLRPNGTPYPK